MRIALSRRNIPPSLRRAYWAQFGLVYVRSHWRSRPYGIVKDVFIDEYLRRRPGVRQLKLPGFSTN